MMHRAASPVILNPISLQGVWGPILPESLYGKCEHIQNKGPYFKAHPNQKEEGKGQIGGPYFKALTRRHGHCRALTIADIILMYL